jgi:hypothetical protein
MIFQEEIYQTQNWKRFWYDRNLCPNENVLAADEVLCSNIIFSQVTDQDPHNAPSSSKDDTDITSQLDLQDAQKYPLQ